MRSDFREDPFCEVHQVLMHSAGASGTLTLLHKDVKELSGVSALLALVRDLLQHFQRSNGCLLSAHRRVVLRAEPQGQDAVVQQLQ